MRIELRPFMVPNFVIMAPTPRSDGLREAPSFPLKDVDAETLARMCDQFRAAVFAKAQKPDPELFRSDK